MFIRNLVRTLLRFASSNVVVRMVLLSLSRADLLPEGLWRRLPVDGIFRVSLPDGGSFAYSATVNDGIARPLFWCGLKWESETALLFYSLAQRSDLVLDIGANTGLFTLLACAANPSSKVISFEPVPRIYAKLVEHIAINGWQERCQARNEAVSNRVGIADFHIPSVSMPSSASLHLEGFRGCEGTLIQVPLTTIDTVCSEDERVDLVKIDVEGFEDKVLEGMRRVLVASAPTIMIECIPDGPFQAVETFLARFGYRFYHLRKEGPVAVDKIVPDESETYRNFLCTVQSELGLQYG